ncbi:MAG TPA: adenylate/guanylate cyclase domain-containing protein, partial [Actinomycetota bacterium]|nr:adenylate/guanylate cyclase domain-containing protein [Actinomycetota bacterium]
MGSTETVTILFTDMVGSTEAAVRLDREAAEELRRSYFALLRRSVAASGTREVKNLGDGLMVASVSVSGALDCAVAMQRAIEVHNRRTNQELRVRIGISAGDATREDDDYFGLPVVEAARLCSAARGGQVLTTKLVRMAAGAGSGHRLHPVGPLVLDGLPEPVAVCELAWAPQAEHGIPLPARLSVRPPAAFVGRGPERSELARTAAAAAHRRHVVLVAGEPGIGKTALASEVAAAARASGSTVLYGRCDADLGRPYQPFVEALGHYVAHSPESVLDAHVANHGGELARLVPDLRRRLAGVPAPQTDDA